ncbi:MAG TPA: hydroxymethylbilane synthase [Candidatus Dormibacteraeota bacterium]
MRVRLATRGSTLALIQAQLVADALRRAHPDHDFVLEPLTTHGDRHPTLKLTESPREGVFVKELERALLDGRAELAVHSAKDLPTVETPGLTIAGYLPRADARDVLICRERATLATLPRGAKVGTGSPRRMAQLAVARPDLVSLEIRGNVDTRLRRLKEGDVDALVLAAAGLERLGRIGEAHERLSLDAMLPAPGQGALAVQAVEGSEAAALVTAIDDADTHRAVAAERALLRRLGGGCLSALGAYATVVAGQLQLRAVVLDADGRRVLRASARGTEDARVVDTVAEDLKAQGATRLLTPQQGSLAGLRILVTRAERQAEGLAGMLRAEGAEVAVCPVIEIEPMAVEPARLAAITGADWLVLTSSNGVDRWFELAEAAKLRIPAHIKVAAIGSETAARLRQHGVDAALVPDSFVAEELAERLVVAMPNGGRVLLARAAGSREVLPEVLQARGIQVDVVETYRAVAPDGLAARLARALESVDLVTLTSSSTVRNFVDAAGPDLAGRSPVACIGPITAATAKAHGLRVAIIAAEFTTRGLVEAIVRSRAPVSA